MEGGADGGADGGTDVGEQETAPKSKTKQRKKDRNLFIKISPFVFCKWILNRLYHIRFSKSIVRDANFFVPMKSQQSAKNSDKHCRVYCKNETYMLQYCYKRCDCIPMPCAPLLMSRFKKPLHEVYHWLKANRAVRKVF